MFYSTGTYIESDTIRCDGCSLRNENYGIDTERIVNKYVSMMMNARTNLGTISILSSPFASDKTFHPQEMIRDRESIENFMPPKDMRFLIKSSSVAPFYFSCSLFITFNSLPFLKALWMLKDL
ncbi:hypothetical protein TNCT_686061 [Trichonephila clavata]|uniref:Uncharacterized protein n=1 Tax=Trichonephila clavata TaxID=2740835 RepID=A0A8X6JJY8_TRICU|nr:hypothetical protein TNCT_686061 [Trichonephila clavata]